MKVKLLKKIRKRFNIKYLNKKWFIYDYRTKNVKIFKLTGMAILNMVGELGVYSIGYLLVDSKIAKRTYKTYE